MSTVKGSAEMKDLAVKQIWQNYLEEAVETKLQGTTFSGFNTNVDVMVALSSHAVRSLLENNPDLDQKKIEESLGSVAAVRTREDFVALLIDGLQNGKSLFILCENPEIMEWLQGHFLDTKDRLGGQAGIISQQMADLGARSVLYSPILSPRQAAVMDPEILYPTVTDGSFQLEKLAHCVRPGDPTHSPWVFEYGKNERFDFGFTEVVTPRANRIILVRQIPGLSYNFSQELEPHLAALGAQCQVGFVAAYHLGGPVPEDDQVRQEYFRNSAATLRRLKKDNPGLKLHFEYVPTKEPQWEREMFAEISPEIDSFGINETEIVRVLTSFGHEDLALEVRERERAYVLYQGALALKDKLGFQRVHVHNLGYYVLVLAKPYPYPVEKVRQACLFGSAVNARKALHAGFVTSDEVPQAAKLPLAERGLEELRAFAEEFREKDDQSLDVEEFLKTGIAELEDHYVLVVPAQIVPNPKATVGMGDTISSSSYTAEVIGTAGRDSD